MQISETPLSIAVILIDKTFLIVIIPTSVRILNFAVYTGYMAKQISTNLKPFNTVSKLIAIK